MAGEKPDCIKVEEGGTKVYGFRRKGGDRVGLQGECEASWNPFQEFEEGKLPDSLGMKQGLGYRALPTMQQILSSTL